VKIIQYLLHFSKIIILDVFPCFPYSIKPLLF